MGAVVLVAIVSLGRWLIDGPAWMFQASLVLIPIALLLAADRARSLGHALSGHWLVTRQGSLVRRRYVLANEGIIGWNVTRSFFQRRAGLATLPATTAAGRQRYDVLDVPVEEGVQLADAAVPGLLTPFLVGTGRPHAAEQA